MPRTQGRMECGELLGIKEVADRFGVATQTIRRLAAKGEIPRPIKIGRAVRWPSNIVEQWLLKKCESLAV